MKGKTHKSWNPGLIHKEDYTGIPSKTIPGESFSIGELMARATRAEDIRLMERFSIDDDDPMYDDQVVLLRKPDLDLTDWQTIAEHHRETVRVIREKLALKEQGSDPVTQPEPEPEPEPEN